MTSLSFARVAPALLLALTTAPLAGGCKTARGEATGAAVPAVVDGPLGQPTADEVELGNGVKVVIQESHVAPLVAIQVWIGAGAADDPPELAGAAHLFEHLVLRGGKRWGPGGGVREIEAVKGSVDAWTGLDETVYQVVVAAPFVDLGLDVLADAIANPNFDPAEIERTRKQALDEIAGVEADPRRRATQAVFAASFGGHGYGRPVMGTAASVAALPAARLQARFAETHVGRAATVVMVGDVGGTAIDAARRAFAAMPAGRSPDRNQGSASQDAAAPVTVTSGGFQAPEIVVGFRAHAVGVQEAAALDLMAAVLARGDGSRMQRELVRNRPLADAVRPVSFRSRDGSWGLWAFAVTPAPQRITEAAEATVGLMLGFARDGITADELARARAVLESDLARASDSPAARARRLGFAHAVARDARDRTSYLNQIRTLPADDLRTIAGQYANAVAPVLAVAVPQGPPAGRDEAPAVLKPRLEAMLRAKAAPDGVPRRVAPPVAGGDAVRFVTPAGVRVLVVKDVTAPLVSVEAAWADPAGAVDDEVASLIAALLDQGTRTRSAAEVAAEMQALGGGLKGFAAPGTVGLRADFFARNLERAVGLIGDAVSHPAFPEDAVESARRAIALRRRTEVRASDGGPQAALGLFQETLLPGTRRADGEALSTLSKLGLLDRYRRRFPLSRLVVAIVGDVDPASAVAAVSQAFPAPGGPLATAGSSPPSPPPAASPSLVPAVPPSPLPAVRGEGQGEGPPPPTTVFRTSAGADSHAVVGYPTFPASDPNRVAVEVLAEILGGEAGRLAGALRANPTGPCLTGARASAAGTPGTLAISLTCAPAQLDGAVATVRAELARVASQGVTPEEAALAARRLIGARAINLRGGMAIADALVNDEARGLPMLAYRRNLAALKAVTAADITRVARAVLDPKREVIAVVHPPSAAPALARAPGKAER
ncbi:MAG TPA: insulinase family protein [Polyangia bacterium]|nr:insulinase family protein [Polyangia bacterium]